MAEIDRQRTWQFRIEKHDKQKVQDRHKRMRKGNNENSRISANDELVPKTIPANGKQPKVLQIKNSMFDPLHC